jgi:hypothetical protein
MVKMKPCGICQEEVPTEETKIRIDLGHETLIPLTSTRNVCRVCYEVLRTTGVPKVRTARLVLA